MHTFPFWLIDLDLWNAFCEVSPWGTFLLTVQRQKKVCTPGDKAIMKIHKKLFSGVPFNFTFFVISPKLQRIWSWKKFGLANRKNMNFHLISKNVLLPVEPWGCECDRQKVLYAFTSFMTGYFKVIDAVKRMRIQVTLKKKKVKSKPKLKALGRSAHLYFLSV